MRHFATESGKSKGQFYTPSEVSRIMAKVIGISPANTKVSTTAYDPTCGSGSLLLKVAAEAGKHITLEGQEKDVTTAGLARMNMILHDFPTANVLSGNTLFDPKFKVGEQLRTYDYVVGQSALLGQDLVHRPHARAGPVPALHLGRADEEAGRPRLPPWGSGSPFTVGLPTTPFPFHGESYIEGFSPPKKFVTHSEPSEECPRRKGLLFKRPGLSSGVSQQFVTDVLEGVFLRSGGDEVQ